MADDDAAPTGESSTADDESMKTPAEFHAAQPDAPEDGDDSVSEDGSAETHSRSDGSPVRLAIIAGLILILALGALGGWLGFRAYESAQMADQKKVFLEVGRQGALNLTVFDYQNVDAQVQRTLDLATGKFYDDFQRRAPSFTELVKQVKSTSTGTVTEAGVESQTPTEAKVLVAVTVKSQVAGQPEEAPQLWRMRLSVEKVDAGAKISAVEFVS